MDRRELLKLLAAASAAPLFGASCAPSKRGQMSSSETKPTGRPMPAIFLAHGAPPLLDDPAWIAELAAWGKALPRPKSILMISAHWEERPLELGATKPVPLIYDFSGFPRRFYELTYPSPGAPELAERVRAVLREKGMPFGDAPLRGLDHGAYIPLMCMYPEADVPVLQVSMPTLEPRELLELGRALAPLRDEGVLIVGSGFLTHNMRAFGPTTPAWATEFDAWAADVLARRDLDALVDYRDRAPAVHTALPTHEHFVPVLIAAGAAAERAGTVTFPITGFAFGAFTKRSVELG